MNKTNPVEPYWEEDPDNRNEYAIQWRVKPACWYGYARVEDVTEEQARDLLQEARYRNKTSGAEFRLVRVKREIYHDGGF